MSKTDEGTAKWQRALEAPAVSAKLPSPRPPLSTSQTTTYTAMIHHFSAPNFGLPSSLKTWKATRSAKKLLKSEPLTPLSDVEKCFLSEEAILRFCRAMKWDLKASISRAEETLVWRREYGVDVLEAEEIEEESKTGKQFVLGYDSQCRPCLHMYPYRQNTNVSPRQIRFVVWCLERTIDLMPPGIETLCLLIDFGGPDVKGGGGQPTTLGQAKQVLSILQTYYGERLGRAVCIHVHWLFWSFYKLVGPFVDPVTKEKIRFNPSETELEALLPAEQRDKRRFGGNLDFVYDHETYFPKLVELAKERRNAMLQRWLKYGNGRIGVSERILRGHQDASLAEDITDAPSINSFDRTASPSSTLTAASFEPIFDASMQGKIHLLPHQPMVLSPTPGTDGRETYFTPPQTPGFGHGFDGEVTSVGGKVSETATHVRRLFPLTSLLKKSEEITRSQACN